MHVLKKYHDLVEHETEKFIERNMECCVKNYEKHIMAKEMLATLSYLKELTHDHEYTHDFDYVMAKNWVEHMKPKAKWTIEETTAAAYKHGIEFIHITEYCWWVAMNKMYSDYSDVLNQYSMDADIYVKMAKAWLFDEDSAVEPKEKLAIEYKYLMKK